MNNFQITRIEKMPTDSTRTYIYYTFVYPAYSDEVNGKISLSNAEYLKAMQEGTIEDPNTGLYLAVMASLYRDVYPYMPDSVTNTNSVNSSKNSDTSASSTNNTSESVNEPTTSESSSDEQKTSSNTVDEDTSETSSGVISEVTSENTSEASKSDTATETSGTESEAE